MAAAQRWPAARRWGGQSRWGGLQPLGSLGSVASPWRWLSSRPLQVPNRRGWRTMEACGAQRRGWWGGVSGSVLQPLSAATLPAVVPKIRATWHWGPTDAGRHWLGETAQPCAPHACTINAFQSSSFLKCIIGPSMGHPRSPPLPHVALALQHLCVAEASQPLTWASSSDTPSSSCRCVSLAHTMKGSMARRKGALRARVHAHAGDVCVGSSAGRAPCARACKPGVHVWASLGPGSSCRCVSLVHTPGRGPWPTGRAPCARTSACSQCT